MYIEGYCSGGVITFNVYGVETRPANREISFRSETLSEEDPVTQFKFDAGQPVGYFNTEQSAHKGVTARLWKTVTVDGTVQSDEVFNNSKYKSSPKIVTVGTAGASAEVVAQLQAAAAANDEGSVKSIAASAAAAAQAAAAQAAQTQTTDPNAAGQTQARRHRLQIRMQQVRHRARSRSSRQDRHSEHRRSKCPQVVVSDVVICNQCTGLQQYTQHIIIRNRKTHEKR